MTRHWHIRWTPALSAMLCDRLGDGLSYSEIAAALGSTRSSIAGKVARLANDWGDRSLERFGDLIAEGHDIEEAGDIMGVEPDVAAYCFAMLRKSIGEQGR